MIRSTILRVAAFALAIAATVAAQDKDEAAVAQANSTFAFDLYARLQAKEGNLFFSPYSISTALAMTWAGARGGTEKEMAASLRFPFPQDRLHVAMAALLGDLNGRVVPKRWDDDPNGGRRALELVVANALWSQKGYPFKKEYLDTVGKAYGAGLEELDFAHEAEAARVRINEWVEGKTNQRIKDLIQKGQLSDASRLVLTNAIYFKAAWKDAFEKQSTKEADFHLAGGGTKKVQMMHEWASLGYLDGGAFEMVEIPYLGDDVAMMVLVPKAAGGLGAVEKELTGEHLKAWEGKIGWEQVALGLPRFQMTCGFELSPELQGLGMKEAFDAAKADFTGMSETKELYIGKVIHKAFVDVNEAGTEAAAATAVVMEAGCAPAEPRKLEIDRPFLFLIHDRKTGSVLFVGRVVDPQG